ncbi:MAG: hypothetical protein ACF8XB_11000 [Planctomycetota bacterium JB042]
MRRLSLRLLVPLGIAAAAGVASGQPNTIPGTDVELGILDGINVHAHTGAFPTGEMSMSMSTTSCNVGSVNVPWLAPMNPDHPFIAFMVARETDGRLEQISDRSFVKHGFYALSSSQCTPCLNPSNGTFLGVGCSDTYKASTNANHDYLGPADEVDPWTGAWDPVCSYFDQGYPPVGAPNDCNGIKSPLSAPDALGRLVRIHDFDLDSPSSSFYYQAHYVVIAEPEANRENNLGSRRVFPNWNGNQWEMAVPGGGGNPLVQGTVLGRWTGATVASATNGNDDGRVYVGFRTQDNGDGTYRYEYALHNRDNFRGIKSFAVPVPPGVTLSNVGFHDIDQDAQNDWTSNQNAAEIVFSTVDNPLRWNTIYNFWFDADAPPSSCAPATLEQYDPGPGLASITVDVASPGAASSYGTPEIGSSGTAAVMGTAGGAPSVGNPNFAVTVSGAKPNSFTFMLEGDNVGNNVQPWGTIVVAGPNFFRTITTTNGLGEASVVIPVLPAMVGTTKRYQYVTRDPGFGGNLQASDGLEVTFCP